MSFNTWIQILEFSCTFFAVILVKPFSPASGISKQMKDKQGISITIWLYVAFRHQQTHVSKLPPEQPEQAEQPEQHERHEHLNLSRWGSWYVDGCAALACGGVTVPVTRSRACSTWHSQSVGPAQGAQRKNENKTSNLIAKVISP